MWRCLRADPTCSCGCRVPGLVPLGCQGLSQCGCSHRQQRRRPLLQLPSQRSMWKQSLRQWPWLLLHCWLSERPLAAGERGMGDLLSGVGNPRAALLVSLAEQWLQLVTGKFSWLHGDGQLYLEGAPPSSKHPSLSTNGLGETASFVLAKLG